MAKLCIWCVVSTPDTGLFFAQTEEPQKLLKLYKLLHWLFHFQALIRVRIAAHSANYSFMRSILRYRSLFNIFLTLSVTIGIAQAQTERLLSEGDILGDIPQVFSASRLPQAPQDAPGAVTVIDQEMIKASGARSVAELFRLVPGFQVGFSRGGKPVVTYHGLSGAISQRMQVLLDGRSLYTPYSFGGVDWSSLTISLEDIERIEVLRGSNSASYGANAFLGVANIITKSAAQSTGVHTSLTAGSNQIRDAVIRVGSRDTNWQWRILGGTRQDDGLLNLKDQYRNTFLDLRTELQLNDSDEISLLAGITRSKSEIGFARSYIDLERSEKTDSSFGLLRWRRTLSPDHEISLTASRTKDGGEDRFIPIPSLETLIIDYGRHAVRDSIEYQHFLGLSDTWRASWGAEYRRDSVQAPQLFNTDHIQRANSLRAYTNFEWRPLTDWTFNLGGLIERDTLSGTQFAPRLVANWKFAPHQTLKLGYSDAFRTPSLYEQRADTRYVLNGKTVQIDYLSFGNLRPETVRTTELAYLGEWREAGFSIDARLFREQVKDLITQQIYALAPGEEFDELKPGTAKDLRNKDTATITGVEYQLRWRPSSRTNVMFNHYMVRRHSSVDFIKQSIPANSVSLLASYAVTPAFNLSTLLSQTSPIKWIGEEAAVGAQREATLRAAYTLDLGSSRGTLALVAKRAIGNNAEFRGSKYVPPKALLPPLPAQRLPSQLWLTLTLDY